MYFCYNVLFGRHNCLNLIAFYTVIWMKCQYVGGATMPPREMQPLVSMTL